MTARVSGTEGYGETADTLVKRYEDLAFADVHRHMLDLFPTKPSRVLDVGAGTGRDAAAFAQFGHTVTAVEPTPELLTRAQGLHSRWSIRWIDDSLPDLNCVHALGERFDLIMLTAVWMHLDQAQRSRAMGRVASLIRPSGLMALSLRHGPAPKGRRMHEVSADETRELAARYGLTTIHSSQRPAVVPNSSAWWSLLAFRASCGQSFC